MKTLLYLAASLLGGLPLASHAQTTALPAAPHFYGGVGVYSSTNQNLGGWYGQARVPVQGVVGYQLRPRLAVQLGLAYSGNSNSYAYSLFYGSSYPSPPVTGVDYAGTYQERSTTTTLLARYGLTRKPTHRFQADVLGGAKFEYARYRNTGTQTTHDQAVPVVTAYESPDTYTQPSLSLGIGLRYRLVSRLEAAYDFTLDLPLTHRDYYINRLQSTSTLSLRYHFNPG
ncbi:hypothetical protein E4631_19115 [Hymenobacter sp. UV11]|uniref:outer membrane beta-barrel protein n=1 Tax=Hymenobacter sp. UV11 TaxID=1849735 RepID=UPI001061C36B|nr:outer membrane beta-barrel protein [Hymenobacter sp. UV11]TDN39655.1 hypothetical protein A8B98_17875 [Hymenobacter sp. UV11]TFZ64623.1 hypothetical protein E4631_19115 [Hymenobacter sp. UV11]